MQDSVTVYMNASPIDVWDLVSDVTKIGRYSPETFEAEWLDGATGPAVGVRFRGHVKRNGKGPMYWTTATITECEAGPGVRVRGRHAGKPLNTLALRARGRTATAPTSPSRSSSPDTCRPGSTGRCSAGRAARRTARACAPRWSA